MTNILSQIQARQSALDDFDIFNSKYKERETEFTVDPLYLSCSLKNLHDQGKGWFQLDSEEVKENITEEIKQQAEQIRDYYTKKFFWTALTNDRRLSDYRSRLLNLLENRIRKCKDQDCGIYFKLPFFYEEDVVYDQFKKTYTVSDLPDVRYGINSTKESLDLTFIKRSQSTQRKRKIERFWFTDQKYLYQIELEQTNPLLDMFTSLLEGKPIVSIEAYRTIDRLDQMYFYKLYKFNFKKDQNA